MFEEWYKISSQPRKYTGENKQKYSNVSNVIKYTEMVYIQYIASAIFKDSLDFVQKLFSSELMN